MRSHIFTSQFLQRSVTGLAIVGMLLSSTFGQAYAGVNVTINGNGSNTENDTNISYSQQTSVTQANTTSVANDVDMNASTGGNTVTGNTGTGVAIKTGSVDTTSSISNSTGSNSASNSQSAGGDVALAVTGNGASSSTTVGAAFNSTTAVDQQNTGTISNDTNITANTGDNSASKNTGGAVSITTGSIIGSTQQNNSFGANTADITQRLWDVVISVYGNGANADTTISLSLEDNTQITQNNEYWIHNYTNVNTNTGGNKCVANTNGDCTIVTGDITFGSLIDNQGGSNEIDIDHGIGGVDDDQDDDDTDDPADDDEKPTYDEEPNGEADIDDDEEQKEKSIIDKIIEKIIPSAHAQTDETVLGAMDLPETGIGTPLAVSWIEVIIGLYLLLVGGYLRTLAQRAQTWVQRKADVN